MAKPTQHTGQQVMLNNGAMQYLWSCPEEGQWVRFKPGGADGTHVVPTVVDEDGTAPWSLPLPIIASALAHFRLDPILDDDGRVQQYRLNNGFMERLFPAEGLEARVTVDGRRVAVLPKDGCSPSDTAALQMLKWALENGTIQVDPILDPERPFRPYSPGVVCGNR